MGRFIYVEDLPPGISSAKDIPVDFKPKSLPVTRTQIIETILSMAPHALAADPSWVEIEMRGSYHIAVNLGDNEVLDEFHLDVHGGVAVDELVAAILGALQLRALDSHSESGLFELRGRGVSALSDIREKLGEEIIASTECSQVQKKVLIAELEEMHQDIRSALIEHGGEGVLVVFERWEGRALTKRFQDLYERYFTLPPVPRHQRGSSEVPLRGEATGLSTK